jgi:hypothetical protein
MKTQILIPREEGSSLLFLGLLGNPDPIEFINLETRWLPYKHASMDMRIGIKVSDLGQA